MAKESIEDLLLKANGKDVISLNNKPPIENENSIVKPNEIYQAKNMLRAKKSASFEDFISMVSKICCIVMEDLPYEVIFVPDENSFNIEVPDIQINKVFITYKLISRTPRREIKPMQRESIEESTDTQKDARSGSIYGQKYKCEVQFNIFASEYKIANEVMKMFEDMIFSFTGYMKENGIENILFSGQLTDTDYDIFRKTISVRNLRYHVDTENLMVIFSEKIQSVITQGSL